MKFLLKPIFFCIIPNELLKVLNSTDKNNYIDEVVLYASESLKQAPIHIRFIELLFRLLFYPIFFLIICLPLERKKKYAIAYLIFRTLPKMDNLMRLYQSLAFFALFETDFFYGQFGLITYKERQKKYKNIRLDLET